MDARQFRDIVERTLKRMGPAYYSDAVVRLLLGTAAAESDFGTHFRQLGGGPGRGFFSMEPFTFADIALRRRKQFCEEWTWVSLCFAKQETDIEAAIVFARLKYRDDPDPIPETLEEQAHYWKRVYNTEEGKGKVADFTEKYRMYVGDA